MYGNEDKLERALGRETIEEMDAMDEDALKKTIVDASEAMRKAKEELEANKEYRQAKADVSLLSSGKREVDKRQKAKVSYSLELLERFGKMDYTGRIEWEKRRQAYIRKLEKEAKKAKSESEEKSMDEYEEIEQGEDLVDADVDSHEEEGEESHEE